jgi:hypothetical protein
MSAYPFPIRVNLSYLWPEEGNRQRGIVADPKQVVPFDDMMEYPPLQHIAAMVISHSGELKGPQSAFAPVCLLPTSVLEIRPRR